MRHARRARPRRLSGQEDVTAMEGDKALEIRSLAAGYGRIPVLHGIDLHVAHGEIVGILGHNGMGKSTPLKAIMGFLPVRSGSIVLDGEQITPLKPHQRSLLGLGYIPQGRGIFPKLSVRDNLRLACQHHGRCERGGDARRCPCRFPAHREAPRSRGRRAFGWRAAASGAGARPHGRSLAPPSRRTDGGHPAEHHRGDGRDVLRLRKGRGLTILLVEQNFDFISALADRVLILERGRITAEFDGASLSDPAPDRGIPRLRRRAPYAGRGTCSVHGSATGGRATRHADARHRHGRP